MNICLFDSKKKKWYPKKYKKELNLIFRPIINETHQDISFGTILFEHCNDPKLIESIKKVLRCEPEKGLFYIIKKIESENMYDICFRDLDGVEIALSDVRHSIKNYLNGLVWAEYEVHGNNDIILSATDEVNKLQLEHIINLFLR